MGSEWAETSVGDVFNLVTGYAFKSKEFIDVGVPVIKIKNVKAGYFSEHEFSYISPDSLKSKPDKQACYNDLLISMSGNRHDGSPETWVGKVALFLHKEKPYLINQRIGALRLKDRDLLDARFASYQLSSWKYQALFISIATSSGGQANLSPRQILEAPIQFPPLPEQKVIAHILGSLDDRIELNRRMNETLESMAQALFKSWFVDFDQVIDNALASGKEIPPEFSERAAVRAALGDKRQPLPAEIRTLFPNEFTDSAELGWIPKGWEVTSLKNLTSKIGSGATPRGGNKVYQEVGTALIRSQNIYDSKFVWAGLARISDAAAVQLNGVMVQREDVLLNITGASILRTCVVIPEVLPARVNQHVAIIRAKEGVPSRYLHLHLLQQRTKDYLMGLNAGGSREAVTKAHIESVPTLTPSRHLLKQFHKITVPIYAKGNLLESEMRTLSSLRDTLLPKLLSGEVRIPEAEKMVKELAL
jgi:type I restriction enzyme, S subunit